MKLILLRHGESQWNLENKFTGWQDVSLTSVGEKEAKFSANQLLKNNIHIDSIITSILKRATKTAHIVSEILGFDKNKIQHFWRLNERHYGALQGLSKSETAKKYGEEQVHIWRRSFDIPPPLLEPNDSRHPKFNNKFKDIDLAELPAGESLKDVIIRLQPFLEKFLSEIKVSKKNFLIVAHSNSLRGIIKVIEQLSEREIISVNIPTGVPLVYDFDENFKIINKEYLINKDELLKRQEKILIQGKAK